QWRYEGAPIAGADSQFLVLEEVTMAQAGSYTVDAINPGGSVTSNAGQLTVVATEADSRLTNISVRTNLAEGRTLILGFVPVGERNMLVRAVGPTLGNFVSGEMSDPRLSLAEQSSGNVIASNDDWEPDLAPVFARLGAFSLESDSRDAALQR